MTTPADRRCIYLVTEGEYSDYRVLVAYETEEAAAEAVHNGVGDDYTDLPLLAAGDIPRKVAIHHSIAREHGGVIEEPRVWTFDEWDFTDAPVFREEPFTAPAGTGYRYRGTDKDRMAKAAQDRAARMRAEREGIA